MNNFIEEYHSSVLEEAPGFQQKTPTPSTERIFLSTRGVINGVLKKFHKPVKRVHGELDYISLAREHESLLQEGATPEEIVLWTGQKLNISAWQSGDTLYGKRGALPAPESPSERHRFQKFIQALGVEYAIDKGIKYDHANGPSKVLSHYFLLDGFVQNAWFGEKNMLKRDKRLLKMFHALKHIKDEKVRGEYLSGQLGFDITEKCSDMHIGYRIPLTSSGQNAGIFIGGSFFKKEDGITSKMVNVLGISATQEDYYENTAATGRLCIVR